MARHKKFHYRINLRIDTDLHNALKVLAEQQGVSVADLCRDILRKNT